MKKLAFFAFLTVIAFTGCDLFSNFTFSDIEGDWEFSDRTINSEAATNVQLAVLSEESFDLGWDTADNGYWFWCDDGSMEGNVFTGVYSGNDDNGSIDVDEPIKITFSLKDGKLTAKFAGSGTLDGVELTEGVPAS